MSRYIVLSVLLTLFSAACIRQAFGREPSGRALDDASEPSHNAIGDSAVASKVANARISVARLKVPAKARQLYQKAARAFVNNATAEAQRRLEDALRLCPTFPEALTFFGAIQSNLQQWKAAEDSLRTAIQSDEGYFPAYVLLAGVYNSEKRFDEAQQTAQQALSTGADSWDVQYELARALIGKHQFENALMVTDVALHLRHHGSLVHLAKAHALLGLRRYSQAAKELRSYLRYEPDGDGSEQARDILNRIQASTGQ